MSLFTLTGILNSKATVVVKDTALTQLKFKVSIPAEVREIGRVLTDECGVDQLKDVTDNTNGVWSHKRDLKEYGIYVDVNFGTELETVGSGRGGKQKIGIVTWHGRRPVGTGRGLPRRGWSA